jgi:hypothetical protein
MLVTPGLVFHTPATNYSVVGFHGTSSLASADIEANGFLPKKVFSDQEHALILQLAGNLGWDTSSYVQWLGVKSVSFAQDPKRAIDHVTTEGKAGGQGLYNLREALAVILDKGSDENRKMVRPLHERFLELRAAPPVVYMVNLSGLKPRLADCRGVYDWSWDPAVTLPTVSEIGPSRIIEKLELPLLSPQAH